MHKRVSVRNLVEFILRSGSIDSRFTGRNRLEEGARVHRKLQKAEGYQAEVFLSVTETHDGVEFTVEGRADGVIITENGVTVDEIKSTLTPLELIDGEYDHVFHGSGGAGVSRKPGAANDTERVLPRQHWAQAMCYGYIYCINNDLHEIGVRLTYYEMETGGVKRFTHAFSVDELRLFFAGLLSRYAIWALFENKWKETAAASMRELGFPFPNYREGQRNLAAAVYRTVTAGGRLFAMAPTGVGKTISTLFPVMKAMGEGSGEKVFYLTARTVTRQAAQVALDKMRERGLRVKSVTLTAKDKICFLDERICRPAYCEFADGHFDRVNDAIMDALKNNDSITAETVADYAKRHRVCPFELALDLTLWSDVVICDYNYLFDPQVYLRRFFADGGDYIFLVDEAHNLADRARDMFSAAISKRSLLLLKKNLATESAGESSSESSGERVCESSGESACESSGNSAGEGAASPFAGVKTKRARKSRKVDKNTKPLLTTLNKINKLLLEKRRECAETRLKTEKELPSELCEMLELFALQFSRWLGENPEPEQDVLTVYFEILTFLKITELFDEHYETLYEAGPSGELTVKQFCADPSLLLDERFGCGRAAVLFSATLTPAKYFMDVLGGGNESKYIALPSPFPRENMLLLIAGRISTRYADRDRSIESVAEMIHRTAAGKTGNYIAYFPSYKYMADVYEVFRDKYSGVSTVRQERGMAEGERDDFLALFESDKETMVAFCVLGGVFAEGIDLSGDRLIGTVIVGTGLPQMNTELDIVKKHYGGAGRGYDFAYRFPGMNKVLQAAGRVIRSGEDRGVVLLIDDRFLSRQYTELYPEHWRHLRAVDGPDDLSQALSEFWNI